MTGELSVTFVLGTRPEIIKLAPVIRVATRESDINSKIIHTGQHYSEKLDNVFFEQLDLPAPDLNLGVGSNSHGEQTGEMIIRIEDALTNEQPDAVLVQGDTNSVLAGAIATDKLPILLGHVEAGLRSFNREMPEESNRRVADHLSDQLYAPTQNAKQQLLDEGISPDRIHVTGNTIVDAVQQNQEIAVRQSSVLEENDLTDTEFGILTAHREENVDDPEQFERLLEGVSRTGQELGLRMLYPIHPRAADRLERFELTVPDTIELISPQRYNDFLTLESNAELIVTDSGGIQEEACILSVPCVTIRDQTERPETVSVGANRIVGTDPDRIVDGALEMSSTDRNWDNPFGSGAAGEKIVDCIRDSVSQIADSASDSGASENREDSRIENYNTG